jgi:hypothetical protein
VSNACGELNKIVGRPSACPQEYAVRETPKPTRRISPKTACRADRSGHS